MDDAHQRWLQTLAGAGRLGDFCPWPKPPHVAAERCVFQPQVVVTDENGQRRGVPPWRAYEIRDHPVVVGYGPGHE